jgi:CRISPR-associated endonuclease/helicase Cas3
MRNHIETQLDHFLNRKQDIFQSDQLRQLLTGVEANHVIFVILASPVAEVGRDHDYDWALVEPSSMRSIIQLAGRVQRHRQNECHSPNIELLSTNCKSLRSNKQATYCRPGFESCAHSQLLLQSKDLRNILNAEQYETINSIHRIQERAPLEPQHNLADLEHAHLRSLMLNEGPAQGAGHYPVEAWWTGHEATLTGFMQRKQPFRKGSPQVRYGLLVDEDDENAHFYEFDRKQAQPISVNNKFPRNEVIPGVGVDLWNYLPWEDYVSQLTTLAEDRGISLWQCSQQFGLVDLPEDRNDKQERWCYHPWLGIGRNA